MDRLTQNEFDYCINECKRDQHCTYKEGYGLTCPDFERYKRLVEYEVTGYEPSAIANLDNICREQSNSIIKTGLKKEKRKNELQAYKDAKEQGLIFDVTKPMDLEGTKRIILTLLENQLGTPIPKQDVSNWVDDVLR